MTTRLIMYALIHAISMVFWEPNGRRLSRETPRAARRERRQLCLQARRGARREGCIYSLATVLGQIGQLCCCNTTTVYRNTVSLALNAFSHCIVVLFNSFLGWSDINNIILRCQMKTKLRQLVTWFIITCTSFSPRVVTTTPITWAMNDEYTWKMN